MVTWGLAVLLALELLTRAHRALRGKPISFLAPEDTRFLKPLAYEPHPHVLYVKRRNHRDARYPSNNLGYVGTRDTSVEKRPNSVRIYCVGGSTVEANDPEQGPNTSWPAKMQDLLNERLRPLDIECINAGAAGYSSAESLSEFMFRGLDLKPDILVVYHNVNDAWHAQLVDGFKSDYSHTRKLKSWDLPWVHFIPQFRVSFAYERIRRAIIARFGFPNALIHRIASLPWTSTEPFQPDRIRAFKRNVKNLAILAHGWACVPVLVRWEGDWDAEQRGIVLHGLAGDAAENCRKYHAYLRANNDALKEIASELEFCHYVEVGPFDSDCFLPDAMHFRSRGLGLMAERMADALEPVIQAVAGRRQVV